MTTVGFIGAGFIANRHAEILQRFNDVRIAAVADPDGDRAAAIAARTGGRHYSRFSDMLERESLDAVFVCVPPFAHGDPERALLQRGIPFLVEKPLAADLATAEEIGQLVDQHDVVTAVGYHWRHLDTVERVRELVAEHPAHLVTGYWLDETPRAAWWTSRRRSGGQTIEQATHILDLARCLVGEVTTVYAAAGRVPRARHPASDVPDVSTATLRFATGALGSISSTCLLEWRHRVGLHLFCEGMAIELSEFELIVDVGAGRPVQAVSGDPVALQDRAFLDAVAGNGTVRASYAEALRSHRLACLVTRASDEGRPLDAAVEPDSRR